MRRPLYLLLFMLPLALSFSSPPLLAQDADLVRHFDYDHKAPLGVKEAGGSDKLY
jgi:hypothetical protein